MVTVVAEVIWIQLLVVCAVQTQPVSVLTPKLPEELVAPCDALLGDNVKLQGAPNWVTWNCWPWTVMNPLRAIEVGLLNTL